MATRRVNNNFRVAAFASWLLVAAIPLLDAAPFAYITNSISDDVTVIDVANSTVVTTVPATNSNFTNYGVAVHPSGTRVYITHNSPGGAVSILNTATNTRPTFISVAGNPLGIAIKPDGSRAYVTHNNLGTTVTVLDTVANTVFTTISVAANPTGVAITPDGSRAYVTHDPGNTVTVIDTATNTVLTSVMVGTNPFGVAINPAGTLVYVAHKNTDDVRVISTASNMVVATIPGGSTPYGVAVSPDGNKVYVANSGNNTVRVIDTGTNLVTNTIPVGSSPQGISISPDGTRVYAVNNISGDVSVINTSTNLVIATVPVGSGPRAFGLFIGGVAATVPGAPSVGIATAGNAQATVTFTPPGSNGGSTITGYTVTSSPGGITGTGTVSPITVAGLTNGTPYTFTVTATNAIGTSAASAASNSVTPIGTQAIIFGGAPSVIVGGIGTVSASGGASGNPVTFTSSTPAVCTASGTNGATVTGVSVGSCTIAANQAGNVSFAAAPQVTQNFAIGIGTQTIIFGAAPSVNVGGIGTVSASGGASGNPVIFSSTTPAVCTASGANGATITGVFGGSCIIAANQAGNASFTAAPQVTLNFGVSAVVPGVPTIGAAIPGNGQALINFTPPVSNGGSPITGYTVSCAPGPITGVGVASPIIVTGLTNAVGYNCSVTATNAIGSSPASATVGVTPNAPASFTATTTSTADTGPGSLNDAISQVNANCGTTSNFINFNIAAAGPQVISLLSALPTLTCAKTKIDGYTQTGATANTLSNAVTGSNAAIRIVLDGSGVTGPGLFIAAPNADIRGIAFVGFASGAAISANANNAAISGNFFGVTPAGAPSPNQNGVSVGGNIVAIGASAPAARNVFACNTSGAIEVQGSADILNNVIGDKPDGSSCGNGAGVKFKIGSTGSVGAIGAGNFIRNNSADAIFVDSANGVFISSNTIVNNGAHGILFGAGSGCASINVRIKGNSIGPNGSQGIQLLAGGGRGINDVLDADGGGCNSFGNNGQNYPVFDLVTYKPNGTFVSMSLASEAGKVYDAEIFSNTTADTGDFGRGEQLIGTTSVTTDAMGVSPSTTIGVSALPNKIYLSMLATAQISGDTSEFSKPYIAPLNFAPAAGLAAFNTPTGTPQTQVVTFFNLTPQLINNVTVGIAPAGNFTIQSETCSASFITVGGGCTVTVQYNSPVPTTDSAVLTLSVPQAANAFTGSDTAFQFPLAGTATLAGTPAITVIGTTTFPATAVGNASGVQAITITNTGTATLTLTGITHSNASVFPDTTGGPAPNAAHWCGFGSVAGGAPSTGAPINIAPLASCVLNLVMVPNLTGSLTGVITVSSNAPTSPTTINVSGTGLAPVATIAPASAAFGNTPVSLGVNLTGTFGNPSAAPYTITSLVAAGLGFSVTPSGASPCSVGAIVAGGGSCTYTATFTATGPGNSNGTVTVGFQPFGVGPSYSAIQSTSGTGFIPPTTNVPASINFGNVPVTLTVSQNYTFTNTSNTTSFPASYTLASIVTAGLGFSAVGSGGTPCAVSLVLAPATSCTMTVSFQIGGTGSSNGTLTIGYQAGFGTNPVFTAGATLVGNGVLMLSSLAPPSVAFGNVTVGTPVTQAFTFTNNSNTTAYPSTYTITSFATTGLGFTAVGSGATPCAVSLTLAPGASCGATVTFQIFTTGTSNGTTTIGFLAGLGTDPPYSKSFGSSGNGVAAPPTPTMTVAFAPTSVGTSVNSTMTLTLSNPNASPASMSIGGAVAIPVGLSVSGLVDGCGASAFIVVSTTTTINLGMAGSIPAMGSCTITVQAQSPTTGNFPVTVSPGNLITSLGNNTNTSTATLTVASPTPVITSATTASGTVGVPFTYTIAATNTPTSFGSGVLPAGLTLNTATGTVSGTPSVAAAATVTITATNAGGTGSGSVTITIAALLPPTISFAVAPATIVVGGTSVGTLTINNPNAVPLTANPVLFNYLPGLVNAPAPNASSTCVGASITAVPGASSYTQTTTFTLPPSGSCTFSATITSATAAVYSGNIAAGLIVTSAGSSNATPFTITVTAAPTPVLTLTPASNVNFGTRTVNTTSPVSTVTLTNTGAANLIISSITSSGDFAFTTTCPISTPPIVPTGTCTFGITFTPLTVAALTGNITITDNAPGSPHLISLTGTGAAVAVPGILISAASVNLGSVTVGATSVAQGVIVTNSGLATLNFTTIAVSGANYLRVFPPTPVGQPNCATSLAPGGQCLIAVTVTPTAVGAVAGQISITHNAAGSPTLVALSATGTAVAVALISVPGTIGFGDQIIATGGTQTLNIVNTGTATLNVSSITVSGTDASRFVASGTCASVAVGATCAITITFTPTAVGARTAQVTIATNASGQPTSTVTLTGNGILAPRPIMELSVTAIGYGNAIFGGASSSQTVTLRNGGGAALNIQSLFTNGDFVVANSCPASVASTASCVINIQFSPLGVGNRTGELVINSNADGSPHRVILSGTGCRWFSQVSSRFFLTSCGG